MEIKVFTSSWGAACTTHDHHIRFGATLHIWNFPSMKSYNFENVEKKIQKAKCTICFNVLGNYTQY